MPFLEEFKWEKEIEVCIDNVMDFSRLKNLAQLVKWAKPRNPSRKISQLSLLTFENLFQWILDSFSIWNFNEKMNVSR